MMRTLNGDHFYEYFMKVMDSGVRFYEQRNEVAVKSIDEAWVNMIMDTLPSLDSILRNPRRFVQREEVIVPIELAKKTGSEAVRHLSTHTHFIDRLDERGYIVPKKIMNIYNEDTFNLDENRFIITLIKVTDQFLSRRYGALLVAMGKEFNSTLKVKSEFTDKDNDEKVAYNLTLKIHQGNDYLGGQRSKDEILFQNIEHIRKMINGYRQTELYIALDDCAPVKSPIKRTNLIMKQHDFKKCYDLWNFLDKYDKPGYTVDVMEKKSTFDESYMEELNTITLFNYITMKARFEDENNKAIDTLNYHRRRFIRPKFISQFIDDIIADYDVTERDLQKFMEQTIKKAYHAKNKSHEDRIIIALTKALNRESLRQGDRKRDDDILIALEKIFESKKNQKETDKKEARIREVLEKILIPAG
jgi:hypothetical protein